MTTATTIDRKKLEAAAEEITVGYRRRYGKAYKEAHVLAEALPELLAEIDRLKADVMESND